METSYNFTFVALSYFISVFGSFTALQLAIRIPNAKGNEFYGWLLGASIALGGGGIWSMHFIAMLAFNTPMTVRYDFTITFASMVLAIVVVAIGFAIVGRGRGTIGNLLAGGVVAGLGVCGMHYLGMEAMIMPADISYDWPIVGLSVVIAIVAATVAMWLAFNLRGTLQRFGSAFVMGIAVCGMHYTGMYALNMTPNPDKLSSVTGTGIPTNILAISIFGVALILLTIFFFISLHLAEKEKLENQLLFK
ncbi:MAG: MHYT domain-containing protein [Chloroflexota bacterium]